MTRKELIKKLRALHIIYKEKFVLRSGKSSNYYCDIKKTFGSSKILKEIASHLSKLIPKNATCVAGLGYGGIPLAIAVSFISGLKLCLVRGKKKNHGRNVFVEGYVPEALDKIVIVDDVISTGGSIKETIKILRKTKGKVIGAIVVIKRGETKVGVPVKTLFSVKELL
ncbi:MAG: orotate phosphoribosyltransferase [Candidatus Lloydbacteria bacterium RIFCSPHIGHO2_01_FULL_41_20]|uniref:Orotate phosphoribosyltransferase n=1 Tax=Candidatus Lloydbacteria bacterium RIFCSPHIGHO2_01_FULL_41_20 TaxID=1798657 RepID=A0A1G2CTL0_9BACT|nr:MAG: orotate phosphoribosyltransferase [Candidatus Lloydbacteria bacterium RIFCSPHIGHO2_01_FULL_41_20]